MALQIIGWDDNGPVYADIPTPPPTVTSAPAPVINTTQIASLTQPTVEQQLLSQLTNTQIGWTPQVYDDIPVLGSGSAGYTSTGYGVTPETTTVLNWQGDYEVVPTGNYTVQLTDAFKPTSDGGQYGYYAATVDSAGNVQDVNFQKAEEHKGWFGENLDWLGPALVLGAAGLGSGLFTGGAGAGAGAGADLAATAVGGVEGAASQLATTAYTNSIAAGLPMSAALSAADVAAGLAGSGLTDAAILESALSSAADTASLGAVDAAGNVIGGGGSLTIDAGAGLGGAVSGMDTAGLDSLIKSLDSGGIFDTPYVDVGDTLGAGITETTGAGTVGGGVGGTGMTLTELSKATGLSETVLSKAASAGSTALNQLIKAASPSLNNLIGGGVNLAAANALFNKVSGLGPKLRDAYGNLATNVQGQYGDISKNIYGNLGGLFDASKAASLGAYANAANYDMDTARQQQYDLMLATMADQRAQEQASLEARRIAQGLGGLQSFNQANSFQYTDPITGTTQTIGADPQMVAYQKAIQDANLKAFTAADQQALDKYKAFLTAGQQQATGAQNLQTQWMSPLLSGVGAVQTLGDRGLQSWRAAEKTAADAYAKMLQGTASGVSQGLTGTDLASAAKGLFNWMTS